MSWWALASGFAFGAVLTGLWLYAKDQWDRDYQEWRQRGYTLIPVFITKTFEPNILSAVGETDLGEMMSAEVRMKARIRGYGPEDGKVTVTWSSERDGRRKCIATFSPYKRG